MVTLIKKIHGLINRITGNVYVFSVISKMTGVVLAVINSIIINRYLGTALKGESAIILNYSNILTTLMGLGIYQAFPSFRKEGKTTPEDFNNNAFSMFIILQILSVALSLFLPFEEYLKIAIILVPPLIYIKQINFIVMIEDPKRQNVASLVNGVAEIICDIVVIVLLRTASFLSVVLVISLKELVNFIISYRKLKIPFRRIRFTLNGVPSYIKYGIIPMITVLMMEINYRVDVLMLKNSVEPSKVGIYSVGVMLAEKIWLIPDALKNVLMSRLTKGKNESEVAQIIRISFAVTLIMLIPFYIFGRPLIVLLYGIQYEESFSIMGIMLMGLIGMIFYKMVYSYNIVHGSRIPNLVFLAIAALCNVVGNAVFIPQYGIYAAALTSVVTYNICGAMFLVFFQKKTRLGFRQMLIIQRSDIQLLKKQLKGS